MIRSLVVTDPSRCVVPWWGTVPFLKGRERIDFGPGLNVVCGPNGSGKSTVLSAISQTMFAHQGGRQTVTKESLQRWEDGVLPDHDGSPVIYFDPKVKVGLSYGGGFDHDFTQEGVWEAMAKESAGQSVKRRMDAVIQALHLNEWPETKWCVNAPDTRYETFLAGSGPKERPTVILDEPTADLDFRCEIGFWRLVRKAVASGVQVITATHSVYAFLEEGVNFIETAPGYADDIVKMFDEHVVVERVMRRTLKEMAR